MKETAEIFLAICKFVGISLSGLFGAVGVIVEYKDKAGQKQNGVNVR